MIRIASAASSKKWQTAMLRAKANYERGLIARRTADRIYSVPSSNSDKTYTVVVVNPAALEAFCDCTCGRHPESGNHCWHVCQAISLEIARVSPKRPSANAAAVARLTARS